MSLLGAGVTWAHLARVVSWLCVRGGRKRKRAHLRLAEKQKLTHSSYTSSVFALLERLEVSRCTQERFQRLDSGSSVVLNAPILNGHCDSSEFHQGQAFKR